MADKGGMVVANTLFCDNNECPLIKMTNCSLTEGDVDVLPAQYSCPECGQLMRRG